MGYLEWLERPAVDAGAGSGDPPGPVLVAAFEGWNDAGDAATEAVELLWLQWQGTTIASIDAEEFYDFTSARPQVWMDGGPRIEWPANEFGWAEPAGTTGVVLLRGVEPQLRWRTFMDQILHVVEELGCSSVVTVGALLADVPHTRPAPVFGTSDDEGLRARFGLDRPGYEGPTGILGTLQAACADRSVPSVALWAAVPSYAPAARWPKATRSLAARILAILGAEVDLTVLDLEAASCERQLDELVAEDDDTSAFVRMLEEQHDAGSGALTGEEADADRLLDEVERFLRDQ